MHELEPYFNWRDHYVSSEDERSPFYNKEYSEFEYSEVVYNYLLHPQWDNFGSPTLFIKILFTDYEEGFTVIELIGEWNDAINNDIMRSEEHTSELQSRPHLVCRLLLEKKK